jgi:hypothetical protein
MRGVFWVSLVLVAVGAGGKAREPAAWGGDHVGKALPEFVSGDECLFCHRTDIGPNWSKNRHGRTVRDAEPDAPALAGLRAGLALGGLAAEVKLLLGDGRRVRYLKRSEAYGKLDLLSVAWDPRAGKLIDREQPHWDTKQFADGCAGCHATAVESRTRAFAALGLDCYSCHGDVPLEHTKDTSQVYLSRKRHDATRVVTSICAQCHVRTGRSRSTGLPYPNQFVAGDNLFRDFQVDWSPERIKALNPGDRHVLENVRAVVVEGKEDVTCLSCHDVHRQSSTKHHRVAEDESCRTCHHPTGPKRNRPAYEAHSATCGY